MENMRVVAHAKAAWQENDKNTMIGFMREIEMTLPELDKNWRDSIKLKWTDEVEKLRCEWSQDENGAWQTKCGNLFEITEGTPLQNKMGFCCYCGKKITETLLTDDVRDKHDDQYVKQLS